ncbi:cytochrome P450 2U1 [Arapaima gigas]
MPETPWQELLSSTGTIVVGLAVFISAFFVLRWRRTRFANIPPGPRPLPLIGNCGYLIVPDFVLKRLAGSGSELRAPPAQQVRLMQQSAIYGPVYSVFVGSQLVVILADYESIRDALVNRAEVFSDRPDVPVVTILTRRKGIVFAPYGPVWRQQRKFCHAALRSFGFGKLSLEPCIQEELAFVKQELLRLSAEGGAVDPAPLINGAVSNVICSISFGRRFQHEDAEFRMMLDLMSRGLEVVMNSAAMLINVFPWLYHLPFGVFKEVRIVESRMTGFLKKIIAQHKSTLDPSNPRDLIDMYLTEMAQHQKTAGAGENGFTEDYLFYIIGDLFIAGTDTTTNTVLWILLYMSLYPDVQDSPLLPAPSGLPAYIIFTTTFCESREVERALGCFLEVAGGLWRSVGSTREAIGVKRRAGRERRTTTTMARVCDPAKRAGGECCGCDCRCGSAASEAVTARQTAGMRWGGSRGIAHILGAAGGREGAEAWAKCSVPLLGPSLRVEGGEIKRAQRLLPSTPAWLQSRSCHSQCVRGQRGGERCWLGWGYSLCVQQEERLLTEDSPIQTPEEPCARSRASFGLSFCVTPAPQGRIIGHKCVRSSSFEVQISQFTMDNTA